MDYTICSHLPHSGKVPKWKFHAPEISSELESWASNWLQTSDLSSATSYGIISHQQIQRQVAARKDRSFNIEYTCVSACPGNWVSPSCAQLVRFLPACKWCNLREPGCKCNWAVSALLFHCTNHNLSSTHSATSSLNPTSSAECLWSYLVVSLCSSQKERGHLPFATIGNRRS